VGHGGEAVTPTLMGRIQTRIFLVAVIGSIWTLIITPLLPVDAPLETKYLVTYRVLLTVGLCGIVWECIYHALMQLRWEKDWPAFLTILLVVPEGLLVWLLMLLGVLGPSAEAVAKNDLHLGLISFLVIFVTTYYVAFLWSNTFMRVTSIRWRFRGGRLI
jgi:hypothetical protein